MQIKALQFLMMLVLLVGISSFISAQKFFYHDENPGKAILKSKHLIVLDESSALRKSYHAAVNFSDYGGAKGTVKFFNSRLANNHVRFEVIEEKSQLVILLSDHAGSPKTVAEWNLFFEKKSSKIAH